MNQNLFVLPFVVGASALFAILGVKYALWMGTFSKEDRRKIVKALFGVRVFGIIGESISESLLHSRIFKVNPKLGFMHASVAFGWFLLIAIGTVEALYFNNYRLSYPWDGVFLRYFHRVSEGLPLEGAFAFVMDLLLAILLTAVFLAWVKRLRSSFFGMKKTTKQRFEDRLAIASLWLIFPLRYLAQSITSGICGGGGFLTGTTGNFLSATLPLTTLKAMELPLWWAYSTALCAFFVVLPFSRYLHIPTEVLLIILRRAGLCGSDTFNTFHAVEASACPRCGICIDKCKISGVLEKEEQLPVYFLQTVRRGTVQNQAALNCMQCGRCKEFCPVAIDTIAVRNGQRRKFAGNLTASFDYIPELKTKSVDVLYFAGCMTHLTPAIKKAMVKIMDIAGVNYDFMDKDEGICCGKPMMATGLHDAARDLMKKNTEIIKKSNARLLVTSCPICYHVFRNDYNLDIKVLHHSEFIADLIRDKMINVKKQSITFAYHDPCELGRLSGVYEAPREVLERLGVVHEAPDSRGGALCCGGSISNLPISMKERSRITADALTEYTIGGAQALVTACPLCKKTFVTHATIPVKDIAEVVAGSLMTGDGTPLQYASGNSYLTGCVIPLRTGGVLR